MIKRILFLLFLIQATQTTTTFGKIVKTNDKMLPCEYLKSNSKCICPGECMIQLTNNSYCKIKNCYLWDNNSKKCKENGESYWATMILNGIPPTGIIGIGDLIMKRSDLFAISLSISLGGCIFLLCTGCCCGYWAARKNDRNEGKKPERISKCYIYNTGILWFSFMIVWWVTRLYFIGTNQWLDGNGCKLIKSNKLIK